MRRSAQAPAAGDLSYTLEPYDPRPLTGRNLRSTIVMPLLFASTGFALYDLYLLSSILAGG